MTALPEAVVPSLDVVVVNFRDPDATARCVRSVMESRYDGALRVIVVENGSGDGSVAMLTALAAAAPIPVRIVSSPVNRGFAGGVNLGWGAAEAELVCLLNNDAELHPEALTHLVGAMTASPGVSASWPFDAPLAWATNRRVLSPEERAGLTSGTHGLLGANIWLPLLHGRGACFTASGVCLMLRRREHDRPFPEEYFAYYEDVLLGWRLRLLGRDIVRVPEAVIYHAGSATSAREPALRPALAIHAEKNRLITVLCCWSGGTLLRLLPLLLLDEARRAVAALAALLGVGPNHLPGTWSGARLWMLRHVRWVTALRREVQRDRVASDREIMPLMSGRLTMRPGWPGVLLNAVALGYCRLVGLKTVELSRVRAQVRAVQV